MIKSLGLTTYESMAYVALVRIGISTAHLLAKNSQVPYGKIYPVLASLEQKGFVRIYDGIPRRFMAIEPKIVVDQAIRTKEQELEHFRNSSSVLLAELGSFSVQKTQDPLESVRIIQGYKNYLSLSVALHKQVKREWCSISELSVFKPHIDAYKACAMRGVRIRMLTSEEEAKREKLEIWKAIGVKIRISEFLPTKFSVIDSTDVTIRMADKDHYVALWIRNPSLAKSMRDYFDVLWKRAK